MKRLLVAMISLLLVSACSSIPNSGPVYTGATVGQDAGNQFIRVIARPPAEGMTPNQIVTGFLEASASFDSGHAIARQYLTPEANASWDPSAGVQAYEGALEIKESGSSILVSASKSGSISEDGRYQVADPGSELVAWFELQQQDGEWRISRAPEDLILSLADVDRAYRSYDVYFFNPDFTTLVPDARTIPVSDSGIATTLVRRLFAGPTDWLAPAVRTGVPEGVALNIDAVPIENGVAKVDLTNTIRLADEKTQRAVSEQMVWTLRQLPGVNAVEITAAGQPLSLPGVPAQQPIDAWPAVNPEGRTPISVGYAISNGRAVKLTVNSLAAARGAAGLGETSLSAIAVAQSELGIAAIDDAGRLYVSTLEDGSALKPVEGLGLVTSVAMDRSESAWAVDEALGPQVVGRSGASKALSIEGLPTKTSVLKIVPSRDGTRAALITRNKSRSSLYVGRVVERAGQLSVGAPIRVETKLTEANDVAWQDSNTLAVLGGDGAGVIQAFRVDIARGLVTGVGAPSDPVSIAAGPGAPVLVGARDNKTYELKAGAWIARYSATSPTYPN